MKTFNLILILCIAFMVSCQITQSELLKDATIPNECKTALEVARMIQKQDDKSALVPLAQACKEAYRFQRCEKYIDNRALFAECNAALK